MSTAAPAQRRSLTPLVLVAAAFLLVGHGLFTSTLRLDAALAMLLLGIAVLVAKPVLDWQRLVFGLLLIILFVPIRRYVLAGAMPIQLEPYRLFVLLLVGGWVLSLLVDSRVSARRTGFEGPLLFLVAVTIASEAANPTRVGSLATPVVKSLTFFVSFIVVVYVIVSVVRTQAHVERMVRTLVVGGAIISAAAIVESRTGFNVFDHLEQFLPFLKSVVPTALGRSGHGRAFGPAQHPIALGAALTMLVPLAAYVATRSRSLWWYFASGLLVLGAFATISRTGIVMLFVVLLFFLWLHPRETRRLWPLVIPVVIATHFFLPGTLGTFKAYFLPSGGIVQQQTVYHAFIDKSNPTWCNIAPRLARIGPMFHVWGERPILGEGYGTRITDGPTANTCVLDDQWLGTLLETGVAGIFAWWWLVIAFVRRTTRVARSEDSSRAWLLGALGTSVASLAVGGFFFDTMSFIQVTFFLFIFLAMGAILLRTGEDGRLAVAPVSLLSPRRPSPRRPAGTPTRILPSPVADTPPRRRQDPVGARPALRPLVGVACAETERAAVREFFELFKTPWGFYENGAADYDILIVTGAASDVQTEAHITLAFGSQGMPIDESCGLTTIGRRDLAGQTLGSGTVSIPLEGPVLTFSGQAETVLARLGDGTPVAVKVDTADGAVIRCGYDLFPEVERLLGDGQDARSADTATLDGHIELLRRWLVATAGTVVEIPPVRAGHPYAVCLTHDVDFLMLRRHRRDRTLLGFLYRGTLGSVRDVVTGRGSVRRLARNWMAVVTLPLVHLGLRDDPWEPFASYAGADGARSTFFVIPYRGRGGEKLDPDSARRRAVSYDVDDVQATLRELRADGFEIAVHGIDAWHSASAGRAEQQRVSRVVGDGTLGVRMHWLCFDEQSYRRLDEAGFDYDATCGYNDAVGFKAGTTQVFRPLDVERLLELPLHVQDTALFYSGRLHLSQRNAWKKTETLRRSVRAGGGVFTVSWHDRSLAPERLWDRFYERLLTTLRSDGAWFGTAREVVDWFRLRRSVTFGAVEVDPSRIRIGLEGADGGAAEAGLLIRVHVAAGDGTTVVDVPWHGESHLDVPLPTAAELEPVAT